jgi:hypothetical protein
MLMRSFSCCGARCIVRARATALFSAHAAKLPEDDDEAPTSLSRGDLLKFISGVQSGESRRGGAELQTMTAPKHIAKFDADE